MKHYVIYIPGLGDSRASGQRRAVSSWRFWGVNSSLFQMNWADGEAFAPKFQRLLKLIDDCSSQGTVSLVAASAGATAAINAFAARKDTVTGVVCIAGKINNPGGIAEHYKRDNPAFWESAQASAQSLRELGPAERRRVLSIRAMFDPIVPSRDSKLAGAVNRITWTSGHALTIAFQITLGAPKFLRFLKALRQ